MSGFLGPSQNGYAYWNEIPEGTLGSGQFRLKHILLKTLTDTTTRVKVYYDYNADGTLRKQTVNDIYSSAPVWWRDYQYDSMGRLKSLEIVNFMAPTKIDYEYEGGRLVKKLVYTKLAKSDTKPYELESVLNLVYDSGQPVRATLQGYFYGIAQMYYGAPVFITKRAYVTNGANQEQEIDSLFYAGCVGLTQIGCGKNLISVKTTDRQFDANRNILKLSVASPVNETIQYNYEYRGPNNLLSKKTNLTKGIQHIFEYEER